MRPLHTPTSYETLVTSGITGDGERTRLAATLSPDQPGLEGYLTLTYTLADQGLYFLPGAFKKTIKERLDHTFHLYQHWPDLVIGKHVRAEEDERGLRMTVQINEDKDLGREVMSDYRFGIPYAWSVGFTAVRDRSGTDADDAKLDRRAVPEMAGIPIKELRAVAEAKIFESSTVTWGSLENAGPDVVQSAFAADHIAALLAALRDGTATETQLATAEQIATAFASRAAAGSDHGTREGEHDDIGELVLRAQAAMARVGVVGLLVDRKAA